jgi:hypothetical protein
MPSWDNWGPSLRDEDSMERIEQEVLASAQARVDLENVNRALQQALADDERRKAVNDQRAIALAAGTTSGVLISVLSHTLFLAAMAFGGVAFLASRDPTEEDSPAGAVARIVSSFLLFRSNHSFLSSLTLANIYNKGGKSHIGFGGKSGSQSQGIGSYRFDGPGRCRQVTTRSFRTAAKKSTITSRN